MALFISTLGMLMATIDSSIVLISLPNIFRGIGIDPLQPGNTFYLLWMILGFLVVTSVLVVTLGRMGDIYGRVRTYNLGFAVFTFFSLMLSITWMTRPRGRGVADRHAHLPGGGGGHAHGQLGGHPDRRVPRQPAGHGARGQPGRRLQRGLHRAGARRPAGPDQLAAGSSWCRCPSGSSAPCSATAKLHETSPRRPARIDWPGNITFAIGLILVMVGITYGIEPYGDHVMGWTNPMVLGSLVLGVVLLIAFCVIETKVPQPMFRLQLFKIRAFTVGRAGQLPRRPQPGRADVHADHLAAGDLAAAARIRLHA